MTSCLHWQHDQSHSREGSSITGDWDERHHTLDEIQATLQNRKEAAVKREKVLTYAFSQHVSHHHSIHVIFPQIQKMKQFCDIMRFVRCGRRGRTM